MTTNDGKQIVLERAGDCLIRFTMVDAQGPVMIMLEIDCVKLLQGISEAMRLPSTPAAQEREKARLAGTWVDEALKPE